MRGAVAAHSGSTALMMAILLCVLSSNSHKDVDFISSTVDTNLDSFAVTATLGMIALVPCMSLLVLLRHQALSLLVPTKALAQRLHSERYRYVVRTDHLVNNWAAGHGLAAALGNILTSYRHV